MKVSLSLCLLLLAIRTAAFLPPENRLTWWLYRLETCTDTTLPGTLPGSFHIHCGEETPFQGLCDLITDRSLSPDMTIISCGAGHKSFTSRLNDIKAYAGL